MSPLRDALARLRPCLGGTILAAVVAAAPLAAQTRFRDDPPGTSMAPLPAALVAADGTKVATPEGWARRREELLELFRAHVYGRVPETPFRQEARLVHEDPAAMGGAATLRQWEISISGARGTQVIPLTLFVPNQGQGPFPVFLLICNRARSNIDPTREKKSGFWPAEEGIARGVAMATFHYEDVQPDDAARAGAGIRGLLGTEEAPDAWGALAAWAWGASRCLDQLLADPRLDARRVALVGHSRGGKAALWAAAQDSRFSLVCANESGCGGAALNRRKVEGRETVARITERFPHWFAPRFSSYGNNEEALPVDQHQLMALIAPRAVAVGSAAGDLWADPRGEFLSLVEARPVFRLLGRKHFPDVVDMPPLDRAVEGDGVHYHIRSGDHNLTPQDWNFYWDFAEREWRR